MSAAERSQVGGHRDRRDTLDRARERHSRCVYCAAGRQVAFGMKAMEKGPCACVWAQMVQPQVPVPDHMPQAAVGAAAGACTTCRKRNCAHISLCSRPFAQTPTRCCFQCGLSLPAHTGKYPNIEYQEEIVDNACMALVKDPSKFDVLVMPNLYGDIVR